MNELLYNHRWMIFADHRCSQVKMVVMQHNNSSTIFTFDLCIHCISNGTVRYAVTIGPGILEAAGNGGVFIGIIEVML